VFDHVTIRVTDRGASERFYNTVLPALGIPETRSGEHYPQWDDFSLSLADEGEPVTRGLHVGFVAPSRADADAFWRVGTGAGYEDDGAPGPRPQYGSDYYGAFLLDPDGNSIEAVHHGSLRTGGRIDHLLPFTALPSPPMRTTVLRVRERSTTPAITARSCSTPTGTMSRSSITTGTDPRTRRI